MSVIGILFSHLADMSPVEDDEQDGGANQRNSTRIRQESGQGQRRDLHYSQHNRQGERRGADSLLALSRAISARAAGLR